MVKRGGSWSRAALGAGPDQLDSFFRALLPGDGLDWPILRRWDVPWEWYTVSLTSLACGLSFAFVPRVFLHLCAFCAFMLVCPFDHVSVCAYVCLCVSYLYVGMLVLFMPSFPSPLMWSFWVHALLPEVFLEAVPLSLGRGVTVYIPPPPYLALAGLGTVVVVVVVPPSLALLAAAAQPYLGLQIGELSLDEKEELLFVDQAYASLFVFLFRVLYSLLGSKIFIFATAVVLATLYSISNTSKENPHDVYRHDLRDPFESSEWMAIFDHGLAWRSFTMSQFFYFDSVESLPTEPLEPSDYKPLNSRYDAQISVFGAKFQKKLEDTRSFVVGSGALGCEFLKNLALMGVSCYTQGKLLTVTDDDVIEKSNLSRQFLFRDWNIGQAKSTVAASAAALIN
ncbi:ubiquitin-activating enzyme E1 1-like protein isoform X2, partial [Tanacetum coccineum]